MAVKWLAELAHDRKVLGLIPAASILESRRPVNLKLFRLSVRKKNGQEN